MSLILLLMGLYLLLGGDHPIIGIILVFIALGA